MVSYWVGKTYSGAVVEDPAAVGVIGECALDAVDSAGDVDLSEGADGYWHPSYLFELWLRPGPICELPRCA